MNRKSYKLIKLQEKINPLIDAIKLFAKREKVLETLIQTIRIDSLDIRKEIGIENVLCK